jgi:hypothetical protein
MRDYAHSHGNGNSRGHTALGSKNTVLALDWRHFGWLAVFIKKWKGAIFLPCICSFANAIPLAVPVCFLIWPGHWVWSMVIPPCLPSCVLGIPCTRAGSLTISEYIHLHWAGWFACMVKCKVYIHHFSFLSWCIMADVTLPSSGCNAPDQMGIPRSKETSSSDWGRSGLAILA